METAEEAQHFTRSKSADSWFILGRKVAKSETVFFSQIIIIYIVVITCIVNLSLERGNSNLWTALLSSSLGYLLPNPKIKKHG
jgi:hypothetical protein